MRCPYRFREFAEDSTQECVPDCALLMDMREEPGTMACALAVLASKVDSPLGYWLHRKYVLPANVVQEGADE